MTISSMRKCGFAVVLRMQSLVWTKRLFVVFAARRSGQHAIMWWVRAQLKGPTERINNCSIPHVQRKLPTKWEGGDAITPLNALFVNFEDKCPASVAQLREAQLELVAGVEALQQSCVLILRDPFNNLASKRQANPERGLPEARAEVHLWKALAREYLGQTNYLPSKVVVNYNNWFQNEDYRSQISEALKLDFSADSQTARAALEQVPGVGQSQFDRREFNGRAQQMDVLNRWRKRLDDPIYLASLEDEELLAISRQLFHLPGIDELLDRLVFR